MRNIYLAAFLLLSTNGFSQSRPVIEHTERGNKMTGVQVQLAYVYLFASETMLSIDDVGTEAGILISPNMGWFIEKNWMMGGMVHLGLYTNTSGKDNPYSNYKTKAFDLGVTPFTRYYFDITKRHNVKVFLQAGLPLVYSEYTSRYSNPTGTFTTSEQSSGLGLYGTWGGGASFHGRFGAIEANLSSLGLNIAFQKFLGKKKD
ncbi:MAG TPA: hypothetical protein VF622_19770 [Segetibacter sp.]